jgi:hypothetical protein
LQANPGFLLQKSKQMNRTKVANELIRLAKFLIAENREAAWTPVRKDVNVSMRNKEAWMSLSSFAPNLSKEIRNFLSSALSKQGYEVGARIFKREWSKYLTFVDPETNKNKYHYYAVYSFQDPAGEILYSAVNGSGRIGIMFE